jgi:hypothetical protein
MRDRKKFATRLRLIGFFGWIKGTITKKDWDNIRSVVNDPVRTVDGVEVDLVESVAKYMFDTKKAEGVIEANASIESFDFTSLFQYIDDMLKQIAEFIQELLGLFDNFKVEE